MGIMFFVLTVLGTRNLFDIKEQEKVSFPLLTYVVVLLGYLVPAFNVTLFIILCGAICSRLSSYASWSRHPQLYEKRGWVLLKGKKNWIWSMYKLFTKKF